MNEQFFYSDNGERKGPVSVDDMKNMPITKETLVWQKGMDDWAPAETVEELKVLFGSSSQTPPPRPPASPQAQNTTQTNTTSQQHVGFPPKTYLIEAILVTIFCCMPFGIAGIVNATRVENLFYTGNIAASEAASREAKKWTKIGFICSLVVIGLYILFYVFMFLGLFGLALSDMNNSYSSF